MNKIVVDGVELYKVSEGLYKTDNPFEIDYNWTKSGHAGLVIAGKEINGKLMAQFVSNNRDGYRSILQIVNSSRSDSFCFEGGPANNVLGGIQ